MNFLSFANYEIYKFRIEDIVTLVEGQKDESRIPTKRNILYYMEWLVKDAGKNDSYVP